LKKFISTLHLKEEQITMVWTCWT